MNNKTFLSLLWSESGYKFVAQLSKYFKHHVVATVKDAVDMIEYLADDGCNIYFSCASYEKSEYLDSHKKRKQRTKENVKSVKCFWTDIDVGKAKNSYETPQHALEAVRKFVSDTGLPSPIIVSSGIGFHLYWPLDKEIDGERWTRIAKLFSSVKRKYGLVTDPSRDEDVASVLRPLNVVNPKHGTRTYVVDEGSEPTSVVAFAKKLMSLAPEHSMLGETKKPAHLSGKNSELSLPEVEYPPSSAEKIADCCAQLNVFRETGSEDEPHWRNCIGVIVHTIEGDECAHNWSSNYSGYSKKECQSKIDNWTAQPTLCSSFANHDGLCEKCKWKGKVKSPIQLGVVIKPSSVDVTESESSSKPVATQTPVQQQTLELPHPYLYQGEKICTSVEDKDGVISIVPVCEVLFYPVERIRDVDGTIVLVFKARIRKCDDSGKWGWREFKIPAGIAGAGGSKLYEELAKYEIVPSLGGKKYMDGLLTSYIDQLRKRKAELQTYKTYGWQPDKSFIMGGKRFIPNDEPKEVLIGGNFAPGYAKVFDRNGGSAAEWVRIVDDMYGHDGHEQYQFVLAYSFGSVLFEMCGINMGGPLHLYGDRGKGKSTVCAVGLSAWGDPVEMSIADPKQGATTNAIFARLSSLHSFPYLVDEITVLDAKELSTFSYHLANARPRDALTASRKRQEPLPPWCNGGFTTANDSCMDKLSTYSEDSSAQMSRILEIEWRGDVDTISPHYMGRLLLELESHYGSAGEVFIQYVVDNFEKVRELVRVTREKFDASAGIGKELRFWSVQLACAICGALLAKKVGLFPFETSSVVEMAKSLARKNNVYLTDRVADKSELVHRLITELGLRLIVTKEAGHTNDRVDVKVHDAPVGRVILNEGKLYLSIASIRSWCSSKQIGFNKFKNNLTDARLLLEDDCRYTLGRGTTIATGQVRCWVLDWNATQGKAVNQPSHLKVVQ